MKNCRNCVVYISRTGDGYFVKQLYLSGLHNGDSLMFCVRQELKFCVCVCVYMNVGFGRLIIEQ